jgi:hypothetical protein
MMSCHDVDRLMTPFIDDECSERERTDILAHLEECNGCRIRVETESTAKHVLHAHAAIARTMGVPPAWRPRVFRLGQPALPVHPMLVLLMALVGVGLIGWSLRPTPVMAVGVIGDSFCEHHHRFTTRFDVDGRECTLGCVQRGAEFVLVTGGQVYRIRNQELPELTAFANLRVKVEGTLKDGRLVVANMATVDP